MSSKDYKRMIMERLLKKYRSRTARECVTNRRILLKPSELYRAYGDNNADILEKQKLEKAVEVWREMGAVQVEYLKYSADIERICLCEDKLDEIARYLWAEYGIQPQTNVLEQVKNALKIYENHGSLTGYYCQEIADKMKDPRVQFSVGGLEADLKILAFLEENTEELFVREASMLVYGDSKWFEDNNFNRICSVIREAAGKPKGEEEKNEAILADYHIIPADQEIFIKGGWHLEWEDYTLDVSKIRGGVAVASRDISRIKKVTISTPILMTVENKTSFQRMNWKEVSAMYLGGFANREQILFLKRVISDNRKLLLYHFGDIDVGGFFIHRHLCHDTGADFGLYRMGVQELKDPRFAGCLRELTENDRSRMEALLTDENYREILKYMRERNVKLEQEIVSYYLAQEQNLKSIRD